VTSKDIKLLAVDRSEAREHGRVLCEATDRTFSWTVTSVPTR
jgi:hypothetical protein